MHVLPARYTNRFITACLFQRLASSRFGFIVEKSFLFVITRVVSSLVYFSNNYVNVDFEQLPLGWSIVDNQSFMPTMTFKQVLVIITDGILVPVLYCRNNWHIHIKPEQNNVVINPLSVYIWFETNRYMQSMQHWYEGKNCNNIASNLAMWISNQY